MNTRAFDIEVRRVVYDSALGRGVIPRAAELAATLEVPLEDLRPALQRLHEAHELVLQREGGEILMANPFSAVPTPFLVEAGGARAWGNCVWDALGVLAMLGRDGIVRSACGCCGTATELEVTGGTVGWVGDAGLAHFSVPAQSWWTDIAFT